MSATDPSLRERAEALANREWKMLVGGELVASSDASTFECIDPSTGRVIASAPEATASDVNSAVAAARAAFPAWAALPAAERAAAIRRLADAIDEYAEELALIDTLDTGTSLRVMRGDAASAAAQLRYFAGLALEVRGETIPTPEVGALDFTLRQPFGVVGRIVPFNHPLMFAAAKLAAPLIAGNTVVLKPSEQTTLSALRLGEICAEVLPAGVVNIVSGDGRVGEAIVRHEDVPRIALIGSVASGRRVQAAAAETAVKSVTLELGGKNPIIVFADADVERALDGAIGGMNFIWQGQSCGSTSRLYVHRSLFGDFVSRLAARLEAMSIGDPFDPSSDVGAIVSERQFRSVASYIESGIADERATLVTGGVVEDPETAGWFIRPTLFTVDDPAAVTIGHEEIFGPVLTAAPFDSCEEVIAKANALRVGLTASVWTASLETAMRAAHELEAGYVWVNTSASHIPGTSFGGVKDSGLGREESLEELLSYTTSKNVYVRFQS